MTQLAEQKKYKIVLRNIEGNFDKILLTKGQYNATINSIQAGQQFITIAELGKTFKKNDIREISKITDTERKEIMAKSNNPITINEDMYIVDNMVQEHKGETIWLEIRQEGEVILSTKKVIYVPRVDGKGNRKRIYI